MSCQISGNAGWDKLIVMMRSYNIDRLPSKSRQTDSDQLHECMTKLEKWIEAEHPIKKIESPPDRVIAELTLKVEVHVESNCPKKALITSDKELYLFYGVASIMCGIGFATIFAAISPF